MRTKNQNPESREHRRWDGPPEHFGFGGGRRGRRGGPGRRARRGDVRAAALALLTERPMHGYEMIQELEERTDGVWRPSPGAVYPALQLLEDQGLVTADTDAWQAPLLADRCRSRGGGEGRRPQAVGRRDRGHRPDAVQVARLARPDRGGGPSGRDGRHPRPADRGGRDPRRHRGASSTRCWRRTRPTPAPADPGTTRSIPPSRSSRSGHHAPAPRRGSMRAAASGSGTGTTRAGAFECSTPRYQWRRVAPHVSASSTR